MARPITLSNGELHVGLNERGMVHDFQFPYVGLENHTAGGDVLHRVGIWVDGAVSWLDNYDWQIHMRYPHSALIGHTRATNEQIGIALEFDDFVDTSVSAFLRNIHIVNLHDHDREVRLFMSQAFTIGDSTSGADTAQYLPDHDAVLHYRGRRAFAVSGLYKDRPFDQYTTGLFGTMGREGTFRDADDGELSLSAAEYGKVDSTIRFSLRIPAHSSDRVHYWIGAGTSIREALYVHKQVVTEGLLQRQQEAADWWHDWLRPAQEVTLRIRQAHRAPFIRSLLTMKSHIDMRGAVIASTDSSLLDHARDTQQYSWPREGALAMWPLIRLGYTDEPRRFFDFCRRGMQPEGYLLHAYRADGAPASSRHPYIHTDGRTGPPIQVDETALVLFMFAQLYQKTQDERLLREFYGSMVKPMATFLSEHIDSVTSLPHPSYDVWEEAYLTSTFTTGAVYGALIAASELATLSEDDACAVTWRATAEDMQQAAHKYLFNHDRQTFYRGILPHDTSDIAYDSTVDVSSFFGAFMFGLFSIDSDEVHKAAQTTKEVLGFSYESPGMVRYEGDTHHHSWASQPNSWWLIGSLWMAQYELEVDNRELAHRTLDWAVEQMSPSGALPGWVSPDTFEPVSAMPYTWVHAEYIATLLDTITEAPASARQE